jgi:hypothetical protein
MSREDEVLRVLRRNAIRAPTSHDFGGRITDSEITSICRDLEKSRIKSYVGVLNPFLFYKYGLRLYLIFARVQGFTDAARKIRDVSLSEKWRNRLSAYGLFGNRDFVLVLLGKEDEKEFLSNWLRREFKAYTGDIDVQELSQFMRLTVGPSEPVSLEKFVNVLPLLASDCRKVDQRNLTELGNSRNLLGFTVLENYSENGPIKAFVAVKLPTTEENKILAYVKALRANSSISEDLVSIYKGIPTELDFGLVFEFDVDNFYRLDEITNIFYGLAPLAGAETETYIVSSSLSNVMPYVITDQESKIFQTLNTLGPELTTKYQQLSSTRKGRILSTLETIHGYDLSIVRDEDFTGYLDQIISSALKGAIDSNKYEYMNCATNCGKLLEGVIKKTFGKKIRLVWPTSSWEEWGGLLQNRLELKQKANPNSLPLGKLILLIKDWDEHIPEQRFFLENEDDDYEKLRQATTIRNSLGAHWNEMGFDRVERDALWALDCTLHLFSKIYQRESLAVSLERPTRSGRTEPSGVGPYDLFICHASEDGDTVAKPLAEALIGKGMKVWYDEFTLTLGDSLTEAIDYGLANSRFGVVILSPRFFEKKWTRRELDGLTQKEISYGKTILPVWHNVDREHVLRFSPVLADKLAVSTDQGLNRVVDEVLKAIQKSRKLEKG